jgi:serine/threonine-protein kinase RsbW
LSWLRFSFESSLDEIFLVSLVVNQVCSHMGLDEVLAYQIELCAVEAVTNAIRHAYRQHAGNEVTVLIRFDAARIDLEIRDRGQSMPPQYVERLRNGSKVLDFDPSDIAALPENGMGLQIIHEVMDETAYSSEGGGNCLRLTKLLRPQTS